VTRRRSEASLGNSAATRVAAFEFLVDPFDGIAGAQPFVMGGWQAEHGKTFRGNLPLSGILTTGTDDFFRVKKFSSKLWPQ